MKFNPEEISLCKQIAEKYGKEIRYGDWHLDLWERLRLSGDTRFGEEPTGKRKLNEILPLWTISDCLEWLGKLESFRAYFIDTYGAESRMLCVNYWDEQDKTFIRKGKTPLEACLKAVLAVLEEKK